jgi:hypothetical protein
MLEYVAPLVPLYSTHQRCLIALLFLLFGVLVGYLYWKLMKTRDEVLKGGK